MLHCHCFAIVFMAFYPVPLMDPHVRMMIICVLFLVYWYAFDQSIYVSSSSKDFWRAWIEPASQGAEDWAEIRVYSSTPTYDIAKDQATTYRSLARWLWAVLVIAFSYMYLFRHEYIFFYSVLEVIHVISSGMLSYDGFMMHSIVPGIWEQVEGKTDNHHDSFSL